MVSQSNVQPTRIKRIGAQVENCDDLLVVEEPLEIRLQFGNIEEREERSIAVTMRTPGNDFELALGFLYSEGIIRNASDVQRIDYCEQVKDEERGNVVKVVLNGHVEVDEAAWSRHFYTSSSCGVCGKSSIEAVNVACQWSIDANSQPSVLFSANWIHELPQRIADGQTVFKHTGGIHAASLFSEKGELLISREDIGRHNAVDKIIGAALAEYNFPLSNYLLMVSGRAGFELIQKAAVAGIGAFAAVGAPSHLAVDLAKTHNMLLLGFVRNNRFNIYHGEERIRTDEE
jgi:FdhD protein